MTKADELAANARGEGCLGKSKDDEPLFILCARDITASATVRKWAETLALRSDAPKAKIAEAYELADRMDAWRRDNGGKVPD